MRYVAAVRPATPAGRPRPGAERPRKSSRAFAKRSRRRWMSADRAARLRRLPAVDQVLREVGDRPETVAVPRPRLTALVRGVLDAERRRIMSEDAEPLDAAAVGERVLEQIGRQGTFSLKPVINATGVVLHTNLGRAPLSALALERIASVAEGYSNLELDLASKERGSRYAHVEELLRRLTGAEDALVVNNNAAAVLLALETLAHGKEVVVAAGVDLVSFSGDKLLGGPQAGIVVGRRELVGRLKKNPWNRALRIDKLTLAALEATLYAYDAGRALETVPTLQLLTEPLVAVRRPAQGLLARLGPDLRRRLNAKVIEDRGQVGGGALPTVELPTAAVALGATAAVARSLDGALRRGNPPAIGRLVDDRLLLDCRTVLPAQINALAAVISAAAAATPG